MIIFRPGMPRRNYQLLRPLGHGGMGEVFEVIDRMTSEHFALKQFSARGKHTDFLQNRFRTESRLLGELNHPGLVKVFDADVDENGIPYFVMELVTDTSGAPRTLETLRKDGLDTTKIARVYADLRAVLLYLHDKGVVHRDIKLENVLIDGEGHVRLADFGIARIFDPELKDCLDVTTTSFIGSRQPVIGSAAYLAPELRAGAPATPASDIWALGVLIFRLLTGVWYEPDSSAHDLLAGFEPEWTRLLDILLAPDPAHRALPVFPPSPQQRFRMWGWVAAGLGAAVLGAFFWSRSVHTVEALVPRTITLAPDVEMTLLPCPAGTFTMGISTDAESPEFRHQVVLTQPFWMGRTQVTRGQWQAYSPETIRMDKKKEMLGGLDAAMCDISGQEAESFCAWLNRTHARDIPSGYEFRLPTEAEWEYALNANCTDEDNPYMRWRNGDLSAEREIMVTLFDFQRANTNAMDLGEWFLLPAMTVATKRPNAWGFHDLLSNCREFVCDELDRTAWTGRHTDDELKGKGLLLYHSVETNPVHVATLPPGKEDQKTLLLRGGDQIHGSWYGKLRGGRRYRFGMKTTFRVCLGPKLPEQTRF